MKIIANIIGVVAVALFLISYQQKKRKNIILCKFFSGTFYVLQYILLGAFEGAILDTIGTAATFLASKKNNGFVKKRLRIIIAAVNIAFVVAGILSYRNFVSVIAVLAAMFEVNALWFTREKTIRLISLVSSPLWLTYNILAGAYGSALGSALAAVSLIIAIYRYDIKKQGVGS